MVQQRAFTSQTPATQRLRSGGGKIRFEKITVSKLREVSWSQPCTGPIGKAGLGELMANNATSANLSFMIPPLH
jgi:hypothetical protein